MLTHQYQQYLTLSMSVPEAGPHLTSGANWQLTKFSLALTQNLNPTKPHTRHLKQPGFDKLPNLYPNYTQDQKHPIYYHHYDHYAELLPSLRRDVAHSNCVNKFNHHYPTGPKYPQ
jgi:hypothetical protein